MLQVSDAFDMKKNTYFFSLYSRLMFEINKTFSCIFHDCKTASETFKVYPEDIKKPWALEQKPLLHFNSMFMPRAKPPFRLCWYSVQVQQPHKQSRGGLVVCFWSLLIAFIVSATNTEPGDMTGSLMVIIMSFQCERIDTERYENQIWW